VDKRDPIHNEVVVHSRGIKVNVCIYIENCKQNQDSNQEARMGGKNVNELLLNCSYHDVDSWNFSSPTKI
jgi:hypothetical protein